MRSPEILRAGWSASAYIQSRLCALGELPVTVAPMDESTLLNSASLLATVRAMRTRARMSAVQEYSPRSASSFSAGARPGSGQGVRMVEMLLLGLWGLSRRLDRSEFDSAIPALASFIEKGLAL